MDKDAEKLKELYARAAGLDENLPGDLLQKLKTYGDILSLTGKLHAAALGEWRTYEALRKEASAKCFAYDPQGTVKEREYKAEFAASDFRKKEAIAERECQRWKNAYSSTTEVIQILKIQFKDLKDVNGGGI